MKTITDNCPKMIFGAVTADAVNKCFNDFSLYKPSFFDDLLARLFDLDRVFVYLKRETHDHLRPYHYHWETLVWILLHNAQDEDKGGTRIYKRMKELQEEGYENSQLLKNMERHVADEKRHAQLFMQTAEIAAKASHMEIADHDDPNVGAEIVEDLLTHVPMTLFKMMGAIFSIEFRSYIMIRNSMNHFAEASTKSKALQQVFNKIASIPQDEKFHVEYTARFLEQELKRNPKDYFSLLDQLAESMRHAGNEMCVHMDQHKKNIDDEGGLRALKPIFSFN